MHPFFRQNIITLVHSLASLVLFTALLWFFVYGKPDPDYNDLLSVLIGALVTIVTVMFSAVLVALQLASAQFSPRITRAFFSQNRFVQAAFYLFLFGIAFGFAVKFTYSTSLGGFRYHLLPVGAAVYGFFLISFVLPRFVFYIADAINAATISRDIAMRTIREIDELYGKSKAPSQCEPFVAHRCNANAEIVRVPLQTAGFLDKIDYKGLNRLAQQHPNIALYLELMVGNFVTPGETAVKIIVKEGQLPAGIAAQLETKFLIGKYRSYDQDVLFGLRQLVDMAIKAISPAVNDPTTCVNCLHYIGVIVGHYTRAQVPSIQVRNAPSNIHYREFTFAMLLDSAFDQIYEWGKTDYVVVSQLLNTLTEIAHGIEQDTYRKNLAEQVASFEIDTQIFSIAEHRDRVERYYQRLMDSLTDRQ